MYELNYIVFLFYKLHFKKEIIIVIWLCINVNRNKRRYTDFDFYKEKV